MVCAQLVTLDFEDPDLVAGTIVSNPEYQYFASYGIQITSGLKQYPVVIFDTAAPTGGDTDLGTPNVIYGGPGKGSGGVTNSDELRRVLIVSEEKLYSDLAKKKVNTTDYALLPDGNYRAKDPDDRASGGEFTFTFFTPTVLRDIGLLDMDDGTPPAIFTATTSTGETYEWEGVNLGNNSYQVIEFTTDTGAYLEDVVSLNVYFESSGAVAYIRYGEIPEPAAVGALGMAGLIAYLGLRRRRGKKPAAPEGTQREQL